MSDRQSFGAPLTRDRQTLLEQWAGALPAGPPHITSTGGIPRRQSRGPAPLSFAQERLWFLEQLHPGQSIYVIPVVLRLRVTISTEALQRALDEIVQRHEVLRSSFLLADGIPRQIVEPAVPCPLQTLDFRSLPPAERMAAALAHLRREADTPFALTDACRLRATLLTLDADDHLLVATFPHIAFDGWSVAPFLRELTDLYSAFVQGAPSPLAALAIQYADYAVWQREQLQAGSQRELLLAYWTSRLAGLRVPEITPDFERPARPTYRAGRQSLTLPAQVVAGLKILAQRESVTPFMALLTAVYILVQRCTTRDDVCVGTSVAGRSHAELEPLIGCCLNTLVLRTDLSGDPRVSVLLGRVRETALGAFAHQALPFELLLQQLQPTRDLSRSPLFQVYVNYLSVGEHDLSGPRADTDTWTEHAGPDGSSPQAEEDTRTPFDLALYARPVGGVLVLSLLYARDLFDTATAVMLLQDLRSLIGQLVEHPDHRISTLDLSPRPALPDGPLPRALPVREGWCPMPAAECDQSIGAVFQSVAARHPTRVAVRTATTSLTYGELAGRSRRIAARIRATIAAGDRVGILLGHDETMLAGVLGVLEGGGAYVPMDPEHPLERLAAIATSAVPAAVLVDNPRRAVGEVLAARAPHIRLVLVEDAMADEDDASARAQVAVAPDALAYVLYTSGSTGVPKGVAQSHRNVLRHVRAYVNSIRLGHDDCLSLTATFGFDAAVMDIFGALLIGATLLPIALRSDDEETMTRAVTQLTVLHATPTVFRHLVASLTARDAPRHVRAVVLGGEPALQTDVALFRRHFPDGCGLVNGLGPTESTLALQYVLGHETAVPHAVVPVGYPVADTEVRLVNVDRHAVGALAVGEIAIRSDRVALGYWKDDELTARAFRPYDMDPRVRTYFSGDLAWRDRAGCFHFAGRRDGQLKIRGVRIEREEVERRLLECPGIEAAAVASTGAASHETLVAYIVCGGGRTPDAAALRRHLMAHLPDAMLPALFVPLKQLPLTISGKVDRGALPAPEVSDLLPVVSEGPASPPQTVMERQLAALWCEVLGVASVNRTDNFFELGGHSLIATQVMSRVRTRIGRSAPLRACFEAPTLEALARVIEQAPLADETAGARADDPPSARAARDRYKVRLS